MRKPASAISNSDNVIAVDEYSGCLDVDRDTRPLPADRDILLRFQSLGDNCEFGLVQRACGIEPLDLLRFAGFRDDASRLIVRLTDALKNDFKGLGDPSHILCEPHGEHYPREYLIYETKWQLQYHSGCTEAERSPEELRSKQAELLRFKRRELFWDLRDAKSIFVWKSNVETPVGAVYELVRELRRRGPNLLLWVRECDAEHRSGFVEANMEGLLEGFVTRFAPYHTATDIDFASWKLLCRNASALAERMDAGRQFSSP